MANPKLRAPFPWLRPLCWVLRHLVKAYLLRRWEESLPDAERLCPSCWAVARWQGKHPQLLCPSLGSETPPGEHAVAGHTNRGRMLSPNSQDPSWARTSCRPWSRSMIGASCAQEKFLYCLINNCRWLPEDIQHFPSGPFLIQFLHLECLFYPPLG